MGSTDNFLPGKAKAAFVALACSAAAADPDIELVEVAKSWVAVLGLDLEAPTLVGAAGAGTEDALSTSTEVEDVATEGVEVGTGDAEVGMDAEVVGTEDAEVGIEDAEVGMEDAEVCTDTEEVDTETTGDETNDVEVGAGSVDVGTGDEVTTVAMGLDEIWGMALEAGIDEEFVPEPEDRVQVFTSRTAALPCASVIGVRAMTQV